MGKILRSAATVILLICYCLPAHAQSSQGTEFWTAYMDDSNPPGTDGGSLMYLYITSGINTSGTVALEDGSFTQPFSVTANKITTITIPPSAFVSAQGTSKKGIHITSLRPIAVYAHIFAQNSSGATLLLPVNTLGKDYFSINYTQKSNQHNTSSTFMVIATEDNTTVEITPAAQLLDGKPANTPFVVTLNKGEVYQGLSATDLTGSRIRSISSANSVCSKIAVFAGSTRIYIGCIQNTLDENKTSSDNLFQQVYPTASWGKNYITTPLKNRNYDIFRIVLSDPATNVVLNGSTISKTVFTNGFYYEFNSNKPNIITADKPIQVVQYAVTQGATLTCGFDASDVGDPEMIYLTPLEQTVNQVTLFSAKNFLILNSYINVLIQTSQVPTFLLDGAHYGTFTTVPGNTAYSYAQVPVASGTHFISAATGFNAIAYGFGVHESYGYAAGTNLQDINSFIALQPPATNILQSNGCSGVAYNLLLTLPYAPASITWDAKDGTPAIALSNPVPQIQQKGDGTTLYVYKYPKSPLMQKAGAYAMQVTAFNPNTDVCGSTEQYELDYNITDPPTAKFTITDNCLNEPTSFADSSKINAAIKTWAWDFGDGQTDVSQNPTHSFAKPGDYNVALTITDVDNCTSIYPQKVHIFPKPKALYTIGSNACVGQVTTFNDQSTTTEGSIIKWIWDFGDGDTTVFNNSTPIVTHTYAKTGTYNVTLSVISDEGCTSVLYPQQVVVSPLPEVSFTMPDVCLNDAFAQFNNKSTIADGTAADLTYLWNFGDPNASPANPNTSTQKDPKHTYSVAANYNVMLTVQSKNGCPVSKTQIFTVNGANPAANFNIENNNSCSSDAVIFDDKSSVNFGNITRMVWYFDYNNAATDSTVYTRDTMPADGKYSHSYGIFNTGGATQNHEVRLVVYSGGSVQSCSNEHYATVTQKANPIVTLTQINDICQGANPVQIGVNTNGFTGTGVFSGPGVSLKGLFNPAVAGPGSATINYTFTSNGCDYSTSEQINVIAAPTVSADPLVNMLEGIPVTLKATANGNNLTYKWTPSTGLDHDNILNPVVNAVDNTIYTLTVTSADNCTAQATVDVEVKKKLVIPSAFTPNGDNINDTWIIKYIENYPGCTVDIFNRNGQKVYTSINYNVPWDGKYKGSYLPTGTYYYVIDPRNGRTTVAGPVTIIR